MHLTGLPAAEAFQHHLLPAGASIRSPFGPRSREKVMVSGSHAYKSTIFSPMRRSITERYASMRKESPRRRRSVRWAAAGLVFVAALSCWNTAALAMEATKLPMTIFTVPRNVELTLIIRLLYAAVIGSAVGWERAASKHSAGVRTMALVSLGAAVFTICSMYGFGGRADPSRMASNVASGVGFIGAGVITTHAHGDDSPNAANVVSGLTTAAAIWLSAAVGVASGVGMYFVAGTAAACTIGILRFGRAERKKLKTRILRTRGTSELHDMSTWDEDIGEDHKKHKKKLTMIKIAKKLPSTRSLKNETMVALESDEMMEEVLRKSASDRTLRRTLSDDDVQPLP